MTTTAKILCIALAVSASIVMPVQAEPPRGSDDYPLEALQKRQQGPVLVDLTPGAAGRFTNCSVLVSSGSVELDQATCKIYMTRATYTPDLDAKGGPVLHQVLGRVDWVIPNCKAAPQTDRRLLEGPKAGLTITALQGC